VFLPKLTGKGREAKKYDHIKGYLARKGEGGGTLVPPLWGKHRCVIKYCVCAAGGGHHSAGILRTHQTPSDQKMAALGERYAYRAMLF